MTALNLSSITPTGLKIRVHGNEQSFDCRPSPLVHTIQDTGWVRLLYIVPSPEKHILCRNMPNARNVFSFLRAVSVDFTVAVLVIASNKMSLADWSIFGDKEMPSIPIFVVSSEVGQQIVERLEDDHLAYAKICGKEVKTISRDRCKVECIIILYSYIYFDTMYYKQLTPLKEILFT